MNFNKAILLSLMVVGILLTIFPVYGETIAPSENELYNKAFEYSAKKDYQAAVDTLNRILTLYPETKNEEVYWKLAEVYDSNQYDYPKALDIYRRYRKLFPNGRFYNIFQERVGYLEKNKRDWDVIREYKFILDTNYSHSATENIIKMEDLLSRYPNSPLTPDIYNWLASNYYLVKKYQPARTYIKKYIATFPGNGKPKYEFISANKQYALILRDQRKYKEALEIVNKTLKSMLIENEYNETVFLIKKERYIWTVLKISLAYLILVLTLIIVMKPWREKNFNWEQGRLLKIIFLLTIVTTGSMLMVFFAGKGWVLTFPTLAVFSSLALVLSKLLTPISYKVNRAVFLLMNFMLMIVVVFISFYWWDTLSVFYQLPG